MRETKRYDTNRNWSDTKRNDTPCMIRYDTVSHTIWYDMIWYYMVWYDMILYDIMRCDITRCKHYLVPGTHYYTIPGMIQRNDSARYDIAWCWTKLDIIARYVHVIRNDIARYSTIDSKMTRNDAIGRDTIYDTKRYIIWYYVIRYDIIWYDMILYDMIRYDIIWYNTLRYDMTRCDKNTIRYFAI